MKDLSISQIENLIARFFEGRTSQEEEKVLYGFFAQEALPPSLEAYKPLFACFDGLTDLGVDALAALDADAMASLNADTLAQKGTTMVRHLSLRPLWRRMSAAVLVLAFSVAALHIFNSNKTFDPYEGSYIIRNGVKITDPELIRPHIEATLAQYLAIEQEQNEKYLEIDAEFKKQTIDFINGFPEGPIRDEVIQSLILY
jgi:hypothetical protein